MDPMQPPAPARGALPPRPSTRPQPASPPPSLILALRTLRHRLRGMVGGENIAPARSPAGSAIVRARWSEYEATCPSRFVICS
eukprot:694793-Pleurochrysis_carterae.AAC.1